jgi:hypothetical protein
VFRAPLPVLALAAALLVSGCGGGQPQAAGGRVLAAAEVIVRLERANLVKNWQYICDELYSAAVRLQAGGKDCPGLLKRVTAGLENPAISLRSVKLGDHSALVGVTTIAEGQEPVDQVIRLVRDEQGRFRIGGLG